MYLEISWTIPCQTNQQSILNERISKYGIATVWLMSWNNFFTAMHKRKTVWPSKCAYIFQVYIFTGFCVGVSILAVLLILIFLTNLESSTKKSEKTRRKDVLAKVSGVVRLLLTSRDQHLLIPLTVVGGITMAFITGDFNVVTNKSIISYWSRILYPELLDNT